ncbi:hypothetical protein [Streptomyces niveus]|uniref:hypothetical protein n=1 Tax=Streptomyces niveus TaxID=193462 RepID=UPI003423479F
MGLAALAPYEQCEAGGCDNQCDHYGQRFTAGPGGLRERMRGLGRRAATYTTEPVDYGAVRY